LTFPAFETTMSSVSCSIPESRNTGRESQRMFTGLIEAVCPVRSVSPTNDGLRLGIDFGPLAHDAKLGDSIAINGVCLTISQLMGAMAVFDVSGETLSKSTLGKLMSAAMVNIERAMTPSGRFGGHFVLGHVDGMARIGSITNKGDFQDITFLAPALLLDQMVPKGSVAVDGISLTIASMDQTSFSVAIIPQTWQNTNLHIRRPGDYVNIETDIIVKTVQKQLRNALPAKDSLTVEKLKQLGF
jgi:riboflavin synthase